MRHTYSRRQIMKGLAATAGSTLLAPLNARSAEIDPRALRIASDMVAVDMHNHVEIPSAHVVVDMTSIPSIDLAAQIKVSGFSVIAQTYSLDGGSPKEEPGQYYARYLQALEFGDRLIAQNHMKRALNVDDVRQAHARKQPIIVQSVEGALFIEGHLERVGEAYHRGLRSLQLIHDRESGPVLGDSTTGIDHDVGLTSFGAEVIRECNHLGLLVDLAHATPKTLAGAVKISDGSLLISHAGMTVDYPRGFPADWEKAIYTPDQVRPVVEAGGVVGVWWRLFTQMHDYVAAIRARVDAIGVDHVGMGTDSDMTSSDILPLSNKVWVDQKVGFFYDAVTEMLRQGFNTEEIAKIGGGNYLRVFGQSTGRHAA